MSVIRVVLVDDHAMMRQGIHTILSAHPDFEVVGEASNGEEALEVVSRADPDVVCMDVEMPGIGGLEATRRLVARPDVRAQILMLTTFEREDYLLAALQAGASGFLLKNARPEHLIDGIRAVAAGEALLSPEVTRAVIERAVAHERSSAPATTGPSPEQLTEREAEVLRLVARGLSNEEIAALLGVGRATVKTHVSNVLMKLSLRDRVQAVAFAYSRFCQLIDMPERTWRRWEAKAKQSRPPKGPWPQPAREAAGSSPRNTPWRIRRGAIGRSGR